MNVIEIIRTKNFNFESIFKRNFTTEVLRKKIAQNPHHTVLELSLLFLLLD